MIPAGVSPLGAFSEYPAARASTPVPILADYVDPETGDITQLLASRTPVDGALIEGVRVERNTGPAVELVGHTLREIRHVDESAIAESRSRARDAVRELERLGLVRFESAEVESHDAALSLEVTVVDLTLAASEPNRRTYAVPRIGL